MERIDLLENTVFQKQIAGNTKFDQYEEKLLSLQIEMRGQRESLQDQVDNFTMKINNYTFEIDKKLIEIKSYKDQIDTNTGSLREMGEHFKENFISMRQQIGKMEQYNL